MLRRIKLCVGASLFLSGFVTTVAGLSMPIYAVQCDGTETITDTECDPAHAMDKHVQTQAYMGCTSSWSMCVAAQNSECGTLHGYQVAFRGLCVTSIYASDEGDCIEDAATTSVKIHYFNSGCAWSSSGLCKCFLYEDTNFAPQYIQICDCVETS